MPHPPAASGTRWSRALIASSAWSVLLVLGVLVWGVPGERLGRVVAVAVGAAVLGSWATWAFTQRRARHPAVLLGIALPIWAVAFVAVDMVLAKLW